MLRPTIASFRYLGCYHQIYVNTRDIHLSNLKARIPYVHSLLQRTTSVEFPRLHYSTMPINSSIEYHWIDGVECLEIYEPGGYHPVMINDILHKRYRIVDKLGYGGYSTIWLARDEASKRYVAVKIGTSSPSLRRREPEILRAIYSKSSSQPPCVASDANSCAALPTILDTFDVCGPNGTHACYALTPAQGSLREASFSRLFPIQVARALAARLATAVAVVHSRGFVHGGQYAASLSNYCNKS